MQKHRFKPAKLVSISKVNHDSRVFTFQLDRPDQPLGLPTGQHVYARLRRKVSPADAENVADGQQVEGDLVQRAYTPISDDNQTGTLELLIKVYHRTTDFPNGGRMTLGFEELEIGDTVEFKGPLGSFEWLGQSTASYRGKVRRAANIGMICGGSGITPIFQVLRAVILDKSDTETKLWLINANKTEADILLRAEIERLCSMVGAARVRQHLVLSKATEGWPHGKGRITVDTLKQHLPPANTDDTIVLVCGPDPMIKNIVEPGLEQLGFDLENDVVIF